MHTVQCRIWKVEEISVSDLLLITDMPRLIKIFDQLAYSGAFSLRVVNNLERGGDEIVIQKPDVVFVQTHLSGFSADILLKHLKKQLGRKRSRFVLLAPPEQIGKDTLKFYNGWLDISSKDGDLLTSIPTLLTSILSKNKIPDPQTETEEIEVALPVPEGPVSLAKTAALVSFPQFDAVPVESGLNSSPSTPTASKDDNDASPEDHGITYPPRTRLSVYSEFNSSFDSAVNKTQEPESLATAVPEPERQWEAALIETADTGSADSKRSTFLVLLALVIVAVVAVTFLQMKRPASEPVAVVAPPAPKLAEPSKTPNPPLPGHDSRSIDKEMITAISENRASKGDTPPSDAAPRPTSLPEFIPRSGLDRQYGASNPGWERYKGKVTEFRVLREAQAIRAIQIIDRGGEGIPESFMKGVLQQVSKTPVFTAETSEKREGYEIQHGHIPGSIKIVYYRDERGGKLRAFVIGWK